MKIQNILKTEKPWLINLRKSENKYRMILMSCKIIKIFKLISNLFKKLNAFIKIITNKC